MSSWKPLAIRWRSLVVAKPLSSDSAPFIFETPESAWVYGAISEPMLPAANSIVRLRLRTIEGRCSAALSVPNGSRFVSAEFAVRPEHGEKDLYFRLAPGLGPTCIVLRNYGVGYSRGHLIAVDIGAEDDLPADQASWVAGEPTNPNPSALSVSESNIARVYEPMVPVSLGTTCDTKLQICRALQARFRDDISLLAFRLLVSPPLRARDVFSWDLFDWQGTDLTSILYYFEKKFQGLYEREDLITDGFSVLNRKTGCEHRHDYEVLKRSSEPVTDALIDAGYAKARHDFDGMVARFQTLLSQPGPFLYVYTCENFPTEHRVRLLLRQLGSRSPDHRFHLLIVGNQDEDQDLSTLSDQVTKAYRSSPSEQAHPFDWSQSYAAWDRALEQFDLRLPSNPS